MEFIFLYGYPLSNETAPQKNNNNGNKTTSDHWFDHFHIKHYTETNATLIKMCHMLAYLPVVTYANWKLDAAFGKLDGR